MSSTQYKVGDFFLLQTETGKEIVGKIEEIMGEKGDQIIIRYNPFYFPEETTAGRQEHNGKHELYRSDEIEKEFYCNIKRLVEVIPLEQYIKRKIPLNFKGVYFYRQKYSLQDDVYLPDLDSTCYCDKIFNPDDEYVQCAKCKEYFHMACYIKSGSKKCYNELCNNIIENQLTTVQLEQEKKKISEMPQNSFLGFKRIRDNDDKDANLNAQTATAGNQEEKYRNLSDSSRVFLCQEIDKIEKEHAMLAKNLSENSKIRQNAKDTILFSLLYGIEELKTVADWSIFKTEFKLTKESIYNKTTAIKYCENISLQIEDLIYFSNKADTGHNYKKKLRKLYTYLIHEDNSELRLSILTNEIIPKKLIEMSSDELAPSSFIKSRLEQQNKYFKEQVLVEEEAKIMTKNHKGEEILLGGQDKQGVAFVPFEVPNKTSEIEIEEEEDDANNNNNLDGDVEMADMTNEEKIIKKKKSQVKNQQKYDLHSSLQNLTEMKYKNLTSDKLKFYFYLEEFKRETLENKINDKIKATLKPETIDELNQMREKFKIKSIA